MSFQQFQVLSHLSYLVNYHQSFSDLKGKFLPDSSSGSTFTSLFIWNPYPSLPSWCILGSNWLFLSASCSRLACHFDFFLSFFIVFFHYLSLKYLSSLFGSFLCLLSGSSESFLVASTGQPDVDHLVLKSTHALPSSFVSGLMASSGHSGSHTPQSMHSSGLITSMFSPS